MKFIIFCIAISLSAGSIVLPESFTANFTQTVTNPKQKVITYSGKIRFSAPSKLKWNYQKPTQKEVCIEGHNMILVDHDLEQISYLHIDKEFDFIKILEQAKYHHENVYVSKYKEQSYTIQIDRKKQIQSVAYYDNLDNKVQIMFKKVKYSSISFNQKSMECTLPKNYDVLQ